MVEFLNKDKAYAEIVEIVRKADSKVVLISPYIKIPDDLMERLKYMDGKGIKTTVVCREKDLKADVKSKLESLRNLDLRFDEDLHAKCFYNEKSMVITSLNLHEHSQQHNREMGILLNLKEDPVVFNEARDEAEFIVGRAKKASATKRPINAGTKETKSTVTSPAKGDSRKMTASSATKRGGYCIRCKANTPLDPDKPYCAKCYNAWRAYENPDYVEKYCHSCGKSTRSTIEYPLCRPCYNKYRS
ncbi:phospholipase D family protein [Chloroflexota bacterium]